MRKFCTILALVAILCLGFAPMSFADQCEQQDDASGCEGSDPGTDPGPDQMQGLVGIQGQLGILDSDTTVDVDSTMMTSTYSSISTDTDASTSTDQSQTSVGEVGVDSHDSVVVEGDETTYEASEFPVNTAAPVFAGNCAQGVSAQWMSGGGSIASGNPVCDYIAVAGAYIAGGDRKAAFAVLEKAENAADWRFFMSRIRMCLTLGIL